MLDPIVVQRTPVTIARIAKATLWFVSQKLSSIMLYLWCFRAAANNLVDIADIFDLCNWKYYSRNIA
jgi:hypothetical protein